jgi:hypothetical protein
LIESSCKQVASPSHVRSRYEAPRISDEVFSGCNQILEEADEDSVANSLTPRLKEEIEQEINMKEEEENRLYLNRGSDSKINKEIYQSKTTLETEENSEGKFEDDYESILYGRREIEHPLSLSVISAGEMSNEEKFISPTASLAKIPTLNLSQVKRMITRNFLNSSGQNSTNYSSTSSKVDRKAGSPLDSSMYSNTTFNSLVKDTPEKIIRCKKLPIDKSTSSKLSKQVSKNSKTERRSSSNKRKNSNEEGKSSWRDNKIKPVNGGFKGNHWDFTKKSSSFGQK